MSTLHRDTEQQGRGVVFTKGAPDVLLTRCTRELVGDDRRPLTDERRARILEANEVLASQALRTLGVAGRWLTDDLLEEHSTHPDERLEHDLTFAGLIGIIDPPRPEAKNAVERARRAGIRPVMITGDHPRTAAVIAQELGITTDGRALTGSELERLAPDALARGVTETSVYARVNPEHRLRIIDALRRSGAVVAMTGDGVDDAPALKKADIGVAMGITGTEVSKEAAVMILTDDNFATIVGAVAYGRALYDNLLKYLRFQMSTLVAYIAIFIGAGIVGIADGAPLNPLQILWLNMVVDIPLAIALGFDVPARGLMSRPPRPLGAPVLARNDWIRLCVQGAVMTIGSLVAYQIGNDQDGAVVGATMLLTTLSLFHLFGALLSRDQLQTVFDRDTFPGAMQLRRYGVALLAIVAITALDFLNRIFDTTGLSFNQWCICIGIAASIIVVEETIKFFLRRQTAAAASSTPAPITPAVA
jgi:Ca2+-transporting ATPase